MSVAGKAVILEQEGEVSELVDERDLGSRAERRPGSSPGFPTMGAGARVTLLVPLAVAAVLALSACGLIGGGGASEEEFLALQQQFSSTKLQLDSADKDISSKQVRIAELEAEVSRVQSEAAAVAIEGKISLEQAQLSVRLFAQQNLAVYGSRWGNVPLVWEVESAEEGEELYYIHLNYRPFQNFTGTPGIEEFVTEKTGEIVLRQVLTEPDPDTPAEPETPPPG